jgi:hypothetical protein|tara:strand:- start:19583 stop:19858 length:276 start_codon:yes stop_codon:yes gene_type:complete
MDNDHVDENEDFLRADEDIADILSQVSYHGSDESNEVSQNDPSDASDNLNQVMYMPRIIMYHDVPLRRRALTEEEQVWPSATRMRVLRNMR